MSWAPEVIADGSGEWCGNGLRFLSKEEAEANVEDLRRRWVLVTDTRVVESTDPVNYKWWEGQLIPVTVMMVVEEQAPSCSICRSDHGPEIQHACE